MPRRRGGGPGGGGGGHDAAGGMRWLLTYADLITLLMVFFVVLYSISKTDEAKYMQLARVLRESLKNTNQGSSLLSQAQLPIDATALLAKAGGASNLPRENQSELLNLEQIGQDLAQALQQSGLEGKVLVTLAERGLVISFADTVFFDLGRAEIKPESRAILDRVTPIINRLPNKIVVEGHTDNLPIRTAQFPSNWELSVARSVAVARYLTEKEGIDPRRVGSTGYGEWRPRFPNDSDEHRGKNRRVDMVLLSEAFSGADTVKKVITPGATPAVAPAPVGR